MTTPTQTYGIILPIAHGPHGYFNQSYTIMDQVKSNLNLLLRTKKGERRMNPDFGSGLWSVVFENWNDDMTQLVETTIRNDISKWMSYVNILSIEVSSDTTQEYGKNKINVSVSFNVPSIGVTDVQLAEVIMNTSNL